MKNDVNATANFLIPATAEENGNIAQTRKTGLRVFQRIHKKHIMNCLPSIHMRPGEDKYISLVMSNPASAGTER